MDCAPVQVSSRASKSQPEIGLASYYAHKFHGRATASGEIYDENKLTGAHPRLPFGTRVQVTNLSNERSVVLKINDRGPQSKDRIIDVSFKAAEELDFVQAGITRVKVEIVKRN
jgi:rare lipoprotein A